MKISTEINSTAKHVGEVRAVELVAAAGFDAYDLSMFVMAPVDWRTNKIIETDHPLAGAGYAAFAKEIAHVAKECGLVCNQSHAPFPSDERMVPYLCRAIECTAIAGGDVCVIHPNSSISIEENAEMYRPLVELGKSCGVRIATENMWKWDAEKDCAATAACSDHKNFPLQLQAIDEDAFVACLDIGHAEMRGLGTSSVELIRALGPRLAALHVHDNDLYRDRHAIPFSMQIDFEPIAEALREVGYTGYVTLEAERHLTAYTPDTVAAGLAEMAAAARRFAAMIEGE